MTTRKNARTLIATGGAVAALVVAPLTAVEAVAEPASSSAAPAQSAAAGTTEGLKKLPVIQDTWSGSWKATDQMIVSHPNLGRLQIMLYYKETSSLGAAPSSGEVAYAIYQDGKPVGFAASEEGSKALPPSFEGTIGMSEEDILPNGVRVDNHGNVYFFSSGLTVLTPTKDGYDSRGTLPNKAGTQEFKDFQSLHFGAKGEPTITTRDMSDSGGPAAKTYVWRNGKFVEQ